MPSDYFRDDINMLEELLDFDLSIWKPRVEGKPNAH